MLYLTMIVQKNRKYTPQPKQNEKNQPFDICEEKNWQINQS